eukprot:TRINITY_DN2054_c0_g1_i1.p4 TRINITY_DN2054_c0_g1~~TRINITY_DN2054_c0_g1_i1.p4  ORF type:complete len:134 (+),score=12.61 TRINITY_DN2054_c0_g1_i1:701-1102(+)
MRMRERVLRHEDKYFFFSPLFFSLFFSSPVYARSEWSAALSLHVASDHADVWKPLFFWVPRTHLPSSAHPSESNHPCSTTNGARPLRLLLDAVAELVANRSSLFANSSETSPALNLLVPPDNVKHFVVGCESA